MFVFHHSIDYTQFYFFCNKYRLQFLNLNGIFEIMVCYYTL